MTRHTESLQAKIYRMPAVAMGAILCVMAASDVHAAAVVSRGAPAATSRAPRANNAASRMPTLSVSTATQATTTTSDPAPAPEPEPQPAPTPEPEPVIIENKSSQFDTTLSTAATSAAADSSKSDLAEQIRRQRAAFDAQDAAANNNANMAAAAAGQSACDLGLRACMQEKCGKDYTKCAGDGDTIWGDKMDACRRDLTCTGHEYTVFSREIKADRDMNVKLAGYNEVLDCGNEYNDCIVTQCGTNYNKCLGKAAGDAAIAKCATIAKNCTQADSGLASRTTNVFATLRQDAEKQVAADEKRLYALRDEMKTQCARLGAMFDERSLDCVFTINFYANNDTTPYASKKGYAGSTFDCTQNWFGIDITTFKENAYRYTRAQTGATNALLGSGVGMAVGAVTSGAIDRAIDRHKADQAVKKAQKEHDENYGEDKDKDKSNDKEPKQGNDQNAKENAPTTPDVEEKSPTKQDAPAADTTGTANLNATAPRKIVKVTDSVTNNPASMLGKVPEITPPTTLAPVRGLSSSTGSGGSSPSGGNGSPASGGGGSTPTGGGPQS